MIPLISNLNCQSASYGTAKIPNARATGLALIGLLVIFIIAISGCSSTPSSSLGEAAMQKIVTEQSKGKITVKAFRKTNGIERKIAGQKIYSLEYSATIQFQNSGWKGGDPVVGYFSTFGSDDRRPSGWDAFGKNWIFFEKHAEVQLTGEIIFESTENGWRQREFNVKTSKILSNPPDEGYYDQFIGAWENDAADVREIRITKEGNQYRFTTVKLGWSQSGFTVIYPENQSFHYNEMDIPGYLHFDPDKRAIYFNNKFYSKVTSR